MSILFSDIRSFTALSEQMTPYETFRFINGYLQRMNPIVQQHGGFIDKFMGDGVMALFPQKPMDALQAAISMQINMNVYNATRAERNLNPIHIGIGIHLGHVMLGIIGDKNRLQSTVISDAVNVAARLEDLTRSFGARILISKELMDAIPKFDSTIRHRALGEIRVRGRTFVTGVVEILEGRPESEIELMLSTRELFERGVLAYNQRYYNQALRAFNQVLAANPQDKAALEYARSIREINEVDVVELKTPTWNS